MRLSLLRIHVLSAFLLVASLPALPQELDEHLSPLEHLLGAVWVGKLDDVELTRRAELILGGKALRETTEAPTLGYTDETTFYWDPEGRVIRLFKLTSRGHVIRGTVTTEGGLVVHEGAATRPDHVSPFRRTFELRPDGRLIDIYYNLEEGAWIRAHHIEYTCRDAE